MLPCLEMEPKTPANCAVIWLHGLGADGHDFAPVVPELNIPEVIAPRFVFPHAPSIPVTINAGYVMPAWYDITSLGNERGFNAKQLSESVREVHALIDREIERGIDSKKIVLVGFSQGGAVNFEAALSYPEPLAGLLALSTYFPSAAKTQLHSANAHIPIHVFHGSFDPMVPEVMAQAALQALRHLGLQAQFKTYPMEHSLCVQEIEDIGKVLTSLLA